MNPSDDGSQVVPVDDGGPAHGTRFTSETASAAGRRGAAARQAKALARKETAEDQTGTLLELAKVLGGARNGVGPTAFAGALALADRIRQGKVPDRHVHYAAQAVAKLVEVGRLEAGDPTSTSLSVTATATDFGEWLHRLRDELAESKTEAASISTSVDTIEVGEAQE
jgi:hypothetical protein